MRLFLLFMGAGALIVLLAATSLAATSARVWSYAVGVGSGTMLDRWITEKEHELILGVGLFFVGTCLAGPRYS